MGIRTPFVVLAGLCALVSTGSATAAEVTPVLTTRSLKDRDIHVSFGWQHEQRPVRLLDAGATEGREIPGHSLDSKDLATRRCRLHTLTEANSDVLEPPLNIGEE